MRKAIANASASGLFHQSWETQPTLAFGDFVKSVDFVELGRRPKRVNCEGAAVEPSPLSLKSARGYTTMFAKFARWMEKNQRTIRSLEKDDILAFLNTDIDPDRRGNKKGGRKELNSDIRSRYLRLLERTFDHIKVDPNPARQAAYALASAPGGFGHDMPKEWLSPEEQDAFMRALADLEAKAEFEPAIAWRRRRDRAMMALMIGAGLTVSEVIELYIENIGQPDNEGSIRVTVFPSAINSEGSMHTTVLRPFAVPYVMSWMKERQEMKLDTQLVFPGRREGGRVVHATLYRQVRAAFARAGIEVNREGGRTLRNSFAQRELAAGTSLDRLGDYLGLHDRRSVERYVSVMRFNNGVDRVKAPGQITQAARL